MNRKLPFVVTFVAVAILLTLSIGSVAPQGKFVLPDPDAPGLGIELDDAVIADHPYVQTPFPSLWDATWIADFTQDKIGKGDTA